MKLTEQDVRHVAELANLELSGDEIAKMVRELDEILTHIDKLNEVDTSNVEPMVSTLTAANTTPPAVSDEETLPQAAFNVDTLRDDVPVPCLGTAAAIANAPLSGAGYFKVPKVIER